MVFLLNILDRSEPFCYQPNHFFKPHSRVILIQKNFFISSPSGGGGNRNETVIPAKAGIQDKDKSS